MSVGPTVDAVLLVVAGSTLAVWAWFLIDLVRGRHGLVCLGRVRRPAASRLRSLPSVSVVVAARNEEEGVERAVRSLLDLEYPRLEVVAVDDRSEDLTGRVLDRLAGGDARLRVIHLDELPPGWLGKTRALQVGADAASGELLLFTDADVVFAPTVLGRAVRHMEEAGLDHLTAAADIRASGPALALFVSTFALVFNVWFRPWRAADPDSDAYVGIGAFNLVRTAAYRRAGGHRSVARDPLDDVHLGRALKRSGARQQCAVAGSMLRVEWYPTLAAAIRGLEKNTLAAVGWSVPLLVAAGVAQVLLLVWPFAAPLVTVGAVRWLNVAIALSIVGVQLAFLGATSLPAWTAPALPLGVLLMQYTWARAAILTLWRGGIEWRGTFYPLDDLRGGR